jgi:capsular exopolysaccharide synthesis family protein
MQGHVLVRPVTDTPIITLLVTWSDPVTSAQIANKWAEVFVQREREMVANQADVAIASLQHDMPAAEEHLKSAQEAMQAYQEEMGIADLSTQEKNDLDFYSSLEAKAHDADVASSQYQSQLEALLSQLAVTPQTIRGNVATVPNGDRASVQAELTKAETDYAAARAQYTDSMPTVIALKARVEQLRAQMRSMPLTVSGGSEMIPNPAYQALEQQADTVRGDIAAAQAQAKGYQEKLKQLKPFIQQFPEQTRRIAELQNTLKHAEDVYNALKQKLQEAQISKATSLSDVTITQPADATVFTRSPNVSFNLLLGFVVGLLLSLTAAFALDALDDRFRTADDVKERLRMPVLATIPRLGGGDGAQNDPMQPLAMESFHQLVASLRYTSSTPPRIIAITSSDQGDGKSTVAVNTAINLGLSNSRVLLVDADLRKPTLHTKLGVGNDKGLSDVIVGVADLSDAIRPTAHTGVWVLTSGRPAPNPVALLGDAKFDEVLRRAREHFDYVVVDSPALRAIVDGMIVSYKTEGTVLVVSAESSDHRSVHAAIERLRSVSGPSGGVHLLGVVLNRATIDPRESTSYYLGTGQTISLPAEHPA